MLSLSNADFERPIRLFKAGRLSEALAAAEALLKVAPRNALLHNLMAAIYAAQLRFDCAVLSLQTALAIEPEFAPAHNNLGFAFMRLGKPDEARRALRHAIKLAPDYADAHNNLGLVLAQIGEREESIAHLRKALSLRSNYADAHNNLGNVLTDAGQIDQAIVSFQAAIGINAGNAGFHENLGAALSRAGKREEALSSFRRAVSLVPTDAKLRDRLGNELAAAGNYTEAEPHLRAALGEPPESAWKHFRYAEVLAALGRPHHALPHYVEATKRDADVPVFWDRLAGILATLEFETFDPLVAEALTRILQRRDVIPPRFLVRPALSLVKHHPPMLRVMELRHSGSIESHIEEVCLAFDAMPFLLTVLSLTSAADEAMEWLVGDVRRAILLKRHHLASNPPALRVQAILALHCFCTEYILDETQAESAEIERLQKAISVGTETGALAVACLAAYRALHQYPWATDLVIPAGLEEVFARQLTDVLEEQRTRASIGSFGAVTDTASIAVKAQYEENPYPRWQNTRLEAQPGALTELVVEWGLDVPTDEKFSESPSVLIAGCGTGQHAVSAAATYRNSNVIAIDLSFNSLAYAACKAREYNLANLQFLQGDLLEVDRLEQKFDVIESVGVLHHMAEPLRGWRVLRGCLKPRGLMAIGLYSTLARRPVAAARAEIARLKLSSDDIRAFRSALLNGEIAFEGDSIIRQTPDFYSMSECRDLLFHVQEWTFSISEIRAALEDLRLRFLGFDFLSPLTIEALSAGQSAAARVVFARRVGRV